MKGIDISNYQKGINLASLKAQGYEIIFIKATEGITINDDCMMTFYNQAMALKLKIGFYHFLHANDPIAEAKHFISRVKGLHVDCLYMIDGETDPVGISARIRTFSDYLTTQGMPTVLYTGENFYNTEILPIARNIPLWVAKYCSTRPSVKSIAWQYSDSNNLDQDIFDEGILLSAAKPISNVVQPVVPTIRQFPITMTANIENVGIVSSHGNNLCTIGTIGKALRLEMFSMTIDGIDFTYSIHEQSVGDEPMQVEGTALGTIGVSKRIEGIVINVTSIPTGFKLQYRGNIQNLGMSPWVDSGIFVGSKNKSLRLEEIEVQVVKA